MTFLYHAISSRRLWRSVMLGISAGVSAIALGACAGVFPTGQPGQDSQPVRLDTTSRIAVMSAFPPELDLLLARSSTSRCRAATIASPNAAA